MGRNPALPVRTPNLGDLADRGVYFHNCFCPSPLCGPSRACLASGKAYHRCRVPNNGHNYPLDQPTYYQALRDAGYRVAGVGKFDMHKPDYTWGHDGQHLLDEWGFTEGIDNEGKWDGINSGAEDPKGPYLKFLHDNGLAHLHVEDFMKRRGNRDATFFTTLPEEAYCDNWLSNNGLQFLRNFPQDQPWHLQVNFTGPHSPWDVTRRMWHRWRDVQFPPAHDSDQFDAETHCEIRRNYAAMVENIDRNVGRFLDVVEQRGELDRTIVVYSSDHGEMLGDHEEWGKSVHYQPSVGVPMIVAGPDITSGKESSALVEMHDLTATFLDYADLAPMPDGDSQSLRPVLEDDGDRDHREFIVSALNDWQTVYDGRYKMTVGADEPILYDMDKDPLEDNNIAADAAGEVERLKKLLPPRTTGVES